jgi:hypothetical protein
MGYEADDLLSIFNTLNEDDIWQYRYPDDSRISEIDVKGIYLGNYVRWDPKVQHEEMAKLFGFQGARFNRTFDTYDHVDCYNYMDLHDHIKLLKHGYSKVTDHACREIRYGRLSKDNAKKIVINYQNKPLTQLEKFLEWLGVNQRALEFILKQHTFSYKAITDRIDMGNKTDLDELILNTLGFQAHSRLDNHELDRYITMGKGWP